MSRKVNVLAIQLCVELSNKDANIAKISRYLKEYAWFKPNLILLPEVFATGVTSPEIALQDAEEVPGKLSTALQDWAKESQAFLIGGSLMEKHVDGKCRNKCMMFGPKGELIAEYKKQHMFTHCGSTEGQFCSPGDETVVVKTPIGTIGLSVCYDLRFPELYRTLALNGAEIITVPAAWPHPRLEHWMTLNKARAIENQCFIMAVNQVGPVSPKRINAGNSMIIDPWGSILAGGGEKEGVVIAQIDLDQVTTLRQEFSVFADRNPQAYQHVKVYEY